jgi:hypothetical protein
MNFFSTKKGISIVEIIIASGIIGISVVGIMGAIQVYLKIVYQNTRETQAVLYLDETAEILQYLRDVSYEDNFESVIENQEYTVFWNGTGYQLATTTITLPYEMNRSIQFFDVERDSSDQIVESGGDVDVDAKKALITVSWPYNNEAKSVSAEMLIHNIYAN